MKKHYKNLFNIDKRPVFSKAKCTSQYTVRFGDCPLCGSDGEMMVTDRKPREWGYCCSCKMSRSLHWLDTKSVHNAEKSMMLWRYWQYCQAKLDTYSLPPRLRKVLGIPRGSEEPMNKFFFRNFLGYCDVTTFKYLMRMDNVRCTDMSCIKDGEHMLIMPIQSSPGFIVGFYFIHDEGYEIVRLQRYEDEQGYLYPNLNSEYVCRVYADLEEFTKEAAMPICLGGLFNAAITL